MQRDVQKNNAVDLKEMYIAGSFKMDLNREQKDITIGPGEEKFVFKILEKRPKELKQLTDNGTIRKKVYDVTPISMGGIEWDSTSFSAEFRADRPRHELIHLIGCGKSGKPLSVATLRRLKDWLICLPNSGGISGGYLISAIDTKLKSLGQSIEPLNFEEQLEWLEQDNLEEKSEKEKEAITK